MKNLPANARDARDLGSIPGSGRSPGGGHDNPLQDSCLESHGQRTLAGLQSQSQTRLKQLSINIYTAALGLFPHLQSMGLQRVGHALAHTHFQPEYNRYFLQ